MHRKRTLVSTVLFFCLIGWICSASATAQDQAAPVADADQPDRKAKALFADESTQENKGDQKVKVGTFGQIDLHVKDLDLTKVLQLLSIQSQRNIVASRNVSGSVSADLYGVDFYQALDAILEPNGFGYKERGQFIFVYTAEELRQIEQAERKVVTKIVRLNYMNAADASTFLRPLLSEAGAVAINGETEQGFQPTINEGGEDSFAHAATLLIRDYPENIEEMMEALKVLDTKPKQVLIEATVLQARLTENNKFGVDISILANFDFAEFANPGSIVDQLVNGSPKGNGQTFRSSPGQVGVGDSTFQLGIMDENFAVFIEALDKVTDTTVLANPKLLVLNRQKSDLLVGERLGYLSTNATETSTTQTVEFLDIGVQLTVRPFVSDDDSIRLELRPSVSDGETVLSNGLVIPNQRTQELVTNVIVGSGQTIVLGGLFKEDTTVTRRQVPFVGDVPILGAAFKGHDDQVDRSEVIFMVKPTVVRDKALYAAGEHAKMSAEYAQLGAREGLLPWSREKMTASHIRDAHTHLQNGNKEKALFSVDMALRLNPTLVEARRLKDQITGDAMMNMGRESILENAIDALIAEQAGSASKNAPEQQDDAAAKGADTPADDATTADAEPQPEAEAGNEADVIQAVNRDDPAGGEPTDDLGDSPEDTQQAEGDSPEDASSASVETDPEPIEID